LAEEIYDIYVIVKETGVVIHAYESEWCRIETVTPGREWLYGFEELKGQPNPDYDFDEPLIRVEKTDNRLQLWLEEYNGVYHADVFAYNRLVFSNVGGPERSGVGASAIVELPKVPPVPPAPPAPPAPPPPGWEAIAERLDRIFMKLDDIKREMITPPIPVVIPEIPGIPPPAPEIWKPITDRLDLLVRRANSYSVVTIDLGTARPTLTEYTVGGFALTVYKCTGTFDIRIGTIATDVITVEPLTYPSMLVIDRMDFTRFYIRNSAQPGKEAVIIVWRRE